MAAPGLDFSSCPLTVRGKHRPWEGRGARTAARAGQTPSGGEGPRGRAGPPRGSRWRKPRLVGRNPRLGSVLREFCPDAIRRAHT